MTVPFNIIVTDIPGWGKNYHLGSIFDGQAPVNDAGYDVDGISVPSHGWLQEWNERLSPITVKRTPADLVASNRMFPFGDTGCKYDSVTALPYSLMGSSSITKYMPTTGERPDIGLITDWTAWFLLTGDAGPMLQIAQAASSVPIHYRDETTGKPIDLLKYPTANCYSQPSQGQPWCPAGPLVDGWPQSPDGWAPQVAHYPEMSFVAHQVTGDYGFLRDLQYSANFGPMADAYTSAHVGKAIVWNELRGDAWALCKFFMAHIATKDAEALGPLPEGLQPSSYFKQMLDNQLAFYLPFVSAPDNQVFRILNGNSEYFGPWQVDYTLLALAFGILTGHVEWLPIYISCLKNAIDRTSGKSGWPPAWTGYYVNPNFKNWGEALLIQATQDGNPISGAEPPTAAQLAALTADPMNGGVMIGTPGYMNNTRATLVMADYLDKLGLAPVRATYPDFDIALANATKLFLTYGRVYPRASVVSISSTPPPPTEIEMASTKLAIGETKHSTLTITPSNADETGLVYSATPDGLVTLAPDATGVNVTGGAPGVAIITASLNGLTATAEADVSLPLALSLALSWDS